MLTADAQCQTRRAAESAAPHRGYGGFGDLGTYICVSVVCAAMQSERISHRRANARPVVVFYREYLAVIFLGQF